MGANFPTVDQSLVLLNAASLTTAYSANVSGAINMQWSNQVAIYIQMTFGSLTSIQVELDFTNDNADIGALNWYTESIDDSANGVVTGLTMQTPAYIRERSYAANGVASQNLIIWQQVFGRQMRIKAKGTGTLTANSFTATLVGGRI